MDSINVDFFVCASTVTLYARSISPETHTRRTPETFKCRKKKIEKLSSENRL